jgi:hypothetical protein
LLPVCLRPCLKPESLLNNIVKIAFRGANMADNSVRLH